MSFKAGDYFMVEGVEKNGEKKERLKNDGSDHGWEFHTTVKSVTFADLLEGRRVFLDKAFTYALAVVTDLARRHNIRNRGGNIISKAFGKWVFSIESFAHVSCGADGQGANRFLLSKKRSMEMICEQDILSGVEKCKKVSELCSHIYHLVKEKKLHGNDDFALELVLFDINGVIQHTLNARLIIL